jgi:hypothetical protein
MDCIARGKHLGLGGEEYAEYTHTRTHTLAAAWEQRKTPPRLMSSTAFQSANCRPFAHNIMRLYYIILLYKIRHALR